MMKDNFSIYNWNIVVLYQCSCDDIDFIIETLKEINCPNKYIIQALNNLKTCSLNIGLTYSNTILKSSVIVINKTSSFAELINTISHEYYHLICHIQKTLEIEDEEELAHLNGNLNMRSYNIVKVLENESRL